MIAPGAGPRLLVSARNTAEALVALDHGADVIDLKEPAEGALGAVAPGILAAAVAAVAGQRPVSATTGDIPSEEIEAVVAAALAVADAGADYVKVGLFPGPAVPRLVAALGARVVPCARTVAVAFADRGIEPGLFAALADAGFSGVVVDTADKAAGRLLDHLDHARLAALVASAHRHGLFIGLAGSLRRADLAGLAALKPDLLGVRGAACAAHDRVAGIDGPAVAALAAELAAARRPSGAAEAEDARPAEKIAPPEKQLVV